MLNRARSITSPTTARLHAALIHLGASAVVAAATAALVFTLWYPMPYREASGGRELFMLIVAVDVVLGPLITLAVFNVRKPLAELRRDLAVVVFLQLAALTYGLHTVAQARPAVVALEGNRLRVVRPIDLQNADLQKAPPGLQGLSWTGPLLVATRPPSAAERMDVIARGLAGDDVGMRPEFWAPAVERGAAFAKAAAPIDKLLQNHPKDGSQIQQAIQATGKQPGQLGYLPVLARRTDWTVLVDLQSGDIVGYVPVDGF